MAQPTAINPQTGQRMAFDGKGWKAVGASGVMSDTTADQNALTAMRADAQQMDMISRRADEFGELNRKTGTGGLMGLNPPWGTGGLSSLIKPFNKNIAAMDAITSDVVPQKRPAGSGSSSDKDTALYRGSFPNVDNTGPANALIRKGIESERVAKQAMAQFYDAFYAKNGTLLGADKAWAAAKGVPPKTGANRPVTSGQAPVQIKTPGGVATVREVR